MWTRCSPLPSTRPRTPFGTRATAPPLSSPSAAITSPDLAVGGVVVSPGDGICAATPGQVILNMGRISTPGMVETDKTILDIMMKKDA